MRKRPAFAVLVVTILLVSVSMVEPAVAIRPVIIMVYGELLPQPVFLTDTMVFHDLENPTTITATDQAGRPYLGVAMFWGTEWNPYVTGEKPLRSLTPEMASQHGWFYPATSDKPAVLLQTRPQADRLPVPDNPATFTWGGVLETSRIEWLVSRGVPAQTTPNVQLDEHVSWVIDSLKRMQSVRPGMTRADLLKLFEPDGGLQTGRVFVFRDCRYFKVDVEWERPERLPTGTTSAERLATIEGQPDDVIKTISKPYIEFMKID